MIGTRPRVTRLVIAALLVLPALVASVSPSLAAPSKQDVEAAKQKLLAAQDQFAALNEQYNQAVYELQQAQQHLDETLCDEEGGGAAGGHRAGRAVQACRPGVHRHGLPVRVAPVGRVDVGVLRPPRVPGGDHPDGRRTREPGRRRGAAGRVGLPGVRPGGRRPSSRRPISSSSSSRPPRTPSQKPSRSRRRPKPTTTPGSRAAAGPRSRRHRTRLPLRRARRRPPRAPVAVETTTSTHRPRLAPELRRRAPRCPFSGRHTCSAPPGPVPSTARA